MHCDLHMHSTASDGTDGPEQLAALAVEAGLSALALTDHDTTAGQGACAAACLRAGIDCMTGIELSADPASVPWQSGTLSPNATQTPAPVGTLHLLGYGIRPDDPDLQIVQSRLRAARAQRNPEIINRLRTLGVKITYEEVLQAVDQQGGDRHNIVGRPHIAQVLVNKGYARTIRDAFARYIGQGKPAYVRKDQLSAADAIAAIQRAGGLAVLAHPVQLRLPDADSLEHYLSILVEYGLDGIETRHPDHAPAQCEQYDHYARRFGLLTTGGSDYHGTRKPALHLNAMRVPRQVFDDLQAALARRV